MELKELKEHYKREIANIAKEAYNDEQKAIANYIIDNANKDNIDSIYTFITQRVKLGFTFDAAPEVNHNCISICKKNEKMSFENVGGIEHKLIIGENYDALKNLIITYANQVDVIYIDPPYNTEKTKDDGNNYKDEVKADKFVYRDKFTRTGWLNMMRERLNLAEKLLSPNGVIFISIDDNMQAYLKVLCDEIFGENNFIGMLNCLDNLKGKENDAYLSYTSHYILIYSKHKGEDGYFNSVPMEKSLEEEYKKIDLSGNIYKDVPFKKTGASSAREDRPSMFYPILIKDDKIYLPEINEIKSLYENNSFNDANLNKLCTKYTNKGYEFVLPKDKNNQYLRWTSAIDSCKKLIEENQITYINGSIYQKKYPKSIELVENSCFGTPKNFIYKKEFANGTIELKNLKLNFDNPKSISLIKYLIRLVMNNKKSIILDFFAGSGTTGQAVMELNAEDGGNRKCILVTNNENNIAKDVTYERLYRVINGKGTKGESFDWTYTKEQPYLTNNSLSVFDLEEYELKIDDYEKARDLVKKANIVFKQLNKSYEAKDFDIYNQLSSLRPYKKEEK